MEQTTLSSQRTARWLLLGAAFCVMMVISIYQYSWFLFADRIHRELGWSLASLGLIYTIFHYTSTLILPFSGYLADSYGPRTIAMGAAILVGAGLVLCALFTSPWAFRVCYGLGGVGGGILYGLSAAMAIKWFPEKRGMASGLVVFGFGAGTALFNMGIDWLLDTQGLKRTLFFLGMGSMAVLLPLCALYNYPEGEGRSEGASPEPNIGPSAHSWKPLEMVRTRQWYSIYLAFTFSVSVVLLFGAHMKTMGTYYSLPEGYMKILMVLFPLANGLSRVMAGAISDKLGRENTLAIFYTLLGGAILSLALLGDIPILLVSMVILASLLGGAPFAIYPATIGDYYGSRYATANYGITYTAKAWAGLISGWLSGYLVTKFGSYNGPLLFMAGGCLIAAVLSNPWVLKPPLPKRQGHT